jgi:hypothetical protein
MSQAYRYQTITDASVDPANAKGAVLVSADWLERIRRQLVAQRYCEALEMVDRCSDRFGPPASFSD